MDLVPSSGLKEHCTQTMHMQARNTLIHINKNKTLKRLEEFSATQYLPSIFEALGSIHSKKKKKKETEKRKFIFIQTLKNSSLAGPSPMNHQRNSSDRRNMILHGSMEI